MFVTNWISTTNIQKISEITNFFRHYFLSRTEVKCSSRINIKEVESDLKFRFHLFYINPYFTSQSSMVPVSDEKLQPILYIFLPSVIYSRS